MAIPTFVGESGRFSGVSAQSVTWPAGHAAGDIGILWVQTSNEAVPATPSGWNTVTNSPQGTGTAATAGSVRLTLFWRIATSSAEAAVDTGDSGDHQVAGMAVFRGVHQTTPILTSAGGTAASSTSVSATGVNTTGTADCLIAVFVAHANDISSSAQFSGWTNGNLASPSITEGLDWSGLAGTGGGAGMAYGGKATGGATGSTTATLAAASAQAFITLALQPPAASPVTVTPGVGALTFDGFAPTISTTSPAQGWLEFDIIVETDVGTTLNVRWAQFVSSALTLTAKGGSYLEYSKIT